MIVERYSFDGFKPQKQIHHLKDFVYPILYFDDTKYPEFLRHFMIERRKKLYPFYKENFDDLSYGIWVFIKGYKSNFNLNHLHHRVPRGFAYLPDDTIVYDPNWTEKKRLDDESVRIGGCYIPKNNLALLKELK